MNNFWVQQEQEHFLLLNVQVEKIFVIIRIFKVKMKFFFHLDDNFKLFHVLINLVVFI